MEKIEQREQQNSDVSSNIGTIHHHPNTPPLPQHSTTTPHRTTPPHHRNNYDSNVEHTIGAVVVMWWLCPLRFDHLGDKIRTFHSSTPPSPQHSTNTPYRTTSSHHFNNYEYNVERTTSAIVVMWWLRPHWFDYLGDEI